MDILLLSASARKKGNSHYLLQTVQKGIHQAGLTGELVYLSDLQINPCQGCLSCAYHGHCPQDDAMGPLLEKILAAPGLVVAAPTYLLSATGLIKILIDRSLNLISQLERLGDQKRWALTISVAGNARWNYLGLELVNLLALAYQYRILDYIEAFAPGPGEVLLQDELIRSAWQKGKDLAGAVTGVGHPRTPSPLQCPSCYSQSFRFTGPGTILCPFCGLPGKIEDGVAVILGDGRDSFFAPEKLQEHLHSWIFATRERFKENLPALKARQAEFLKQEDFSH